MTAPFHQAFAQRVAAWRRRDDVRHHADPELAEAHRHREAARAHPRSLLDPLR